MFSSFGSYSSSKTTTISRQQHLESYLNDPTLKASTRKVGNGDSTYDTVFQTKGGSALIVRVHLSERNVTPMMTLIGVQARHPWIDNRMRVIGYAEISSPNAWLSSGLTLGKAVNDVVRHFQLNPPTEIQITDMSLLQIQNRMNATQSRPQQYNNVSAQNSNISASQTNVPAHQFAKVTEIKSDLPPYFGDVLVFTSDDAITHESVLSSMYFPSPPTSFVEVDNMDIAQLNNLLRDEKAFKQEMRKLPYVKEMESIKREKSKEIQNLANDNIAKKEELESLQETVEELQNSLQEKVTAYNDLKDKQTALCKPADKKAVIKKLMIGKRETYNQSEDIASDWLENGTDLDDFIKSFIELRTVHHVRAAKIERIQNM